MKKILIIVAVIIVAILGINVVKDQIIKSVITVVASQVTGASVHIDGFSLGILSQSVKITGFKMYNPPGFSKGIMVDLPKVAVAFDLGSLFKKKIHLKNLEIELKELGLEKNKEGKLNVDALKVAQQPAAKKESKPAEQMPIQIDVVKLGMGRVVSKDFSSGPEPAIQVYDINIHKTYKNISSVQLLVALILSEPMKAAGIKGAAIYGVSMLAGVAILPVAVAATFAAKDSAQKDYNASWDNAYGVSLKALKEMGKVTREDKAGGIIAADVDGASINLKLKKIANNKTQIIVSARKYFLPKPEIAGGVLYKISAGLK